MITDQVICQVVQQGLSKTDPMYTFITPFLQRSVITWWQGFRWLALFWAPRHLNAAPCPQSAPTCWYPLHPSGDLQAFTQIKQTAVVVWYHGNRAYLSAFAQSSWRHLHWNRVDRLCWDACQSRHRWQPPPRPLPALSKRQLGAKYQKLCTFTHMYMCVVGLLRPPAYESKYE